MFATAFRRLYRRRSPRESITNDEPLFALRDDGRRKALSGRLQGDRPSACLAEAHGIVLLNGGGFEAPNWSLRVSLANLPDEAYDDIGRGVRTIDRGYRDAFEASKTAPKK